MAIQRAAFEAALSLSASAWAQSPIVCSWSEPRRGARPTLHTRSNCNSDPRYAAGSPVTDGGHETGVTMPYHGLVIIFLVPIRYKATIIPKTSDPLLRGPGAPPSPPSPGPLSSSTSTTFLKAFAGRLGTPSRRTAGTAGCLFPTLTYLF